jgi:uncharacterized protein YukE
MPLLVTRLDETHFSQVCETLVVNAHGCAISSRVKLDAGVPLQLHSQDGRKTTAQVVSCQPMRADNQMWILGARLNRPENFWMLRNVPEDWTLSLTSGLPTVPRLPAPVQGSIVPSMAVPFTGVPTTAVPSVLPGRRSEVTAQLAASSQLSEESVRKMIVESLHPLAAEITAVKEKLARSEANRSRFDVSLSSIPPELEQQLEQRLRQDLGPKIVGEAREQSTRVISETKAAIEQKVIEVRDEFQRTSKAEFQAVEHRAGEISTRIVASIREQLRDGVSEFQRKLVDGRSQIKRITDELLESLQTRLSDEHNARRGELEKLRVEVTAERSRLLEEIDKLDGRIGKLDESVCSLESGLDKRLGQMSGETVKNTRDEIAAVTDTMLQEFSARSAQTLGDQMDETAGNMRTLQEGVVASVSASLRAQSAEALQDFEHSIDELARGSIGRWRNRLTDGLNALVKNLGEHFS